MQEPANENLTFGPCPKCGQPLRLGLIEPDESDHEKRTYQCDSCGYSEIKTVNTAEAGLGAPTSGLLPISTAVVTSRTPSSPIRAEPITA